MNRDPRFYRRLAFYSSIVFLLPTTIVWGFLVGQYLDERWGTRPWLAIVGFLLGVLGAGFEVFRILKAEHAKSDS